MLEVSHESCQQPIALDTRPNRILLSQLGSANCGFEHSTLRLEAKPGHTLNITLYDFTGSASGPHSQCAVQHARLRDMASSQMVDVCSGRARVQPLMVSARNAVQLTLSSDNFANTPLLLEIQGKLSNHLAGQNSQTFYKHQQMSDS